MARIRTVKPELAKHELMFDAEIETGLPLRFAWVMLFTVCDREGRFPWRPRALKSDILPYDEVDFSRVLDAWLTRGFLVRYRVGHEWYGWIPTFRRHQVINPREAASILPGIDDADEVIDHRNQPDTHASPTRKPRVDDASVTRHVHARGEGKGREGKGREGNTQARVDDACSARDERDPKETEASRRLTPEAAMAIPLRKAGVQVTSAHPVLVAWVQDGITIEQALAAVEIARAGAKPAGPIPARYLDTIIRSPPRPGGGNGGAMTRYARAKARLTIPTDEHGNPVDEDGNPIPF